MNTSLVAMLPILEFLSKRRSYDQGFKFELETVFKYVNLKQGFVFSF